MKGQYITLENMLFFAIGVVMIITVYAVFSSISDSISSAVVQNQLAKEGENIRAAIVKSFTAGNLTNSTIKFSLGMPRELSGCVYKITATEGKLFLSCTGNTYSKSLYLYEIETKVKNGAAYSSYGKLDIFYSDGKVFIS